MSYTCALSTIPAGCLYSSTLPLTVLDALSASRFHFRLMFLKPIVFQQMMSGATPMIGTYTFWSNTDTITATSGTALIVAKSESVILGKWTAREFAVSERRAPYTPSQNTRTIFARVSVGLHSRAVINAHEGRLDRFWRNVVLRLFQNHRMGRTKAPYSRRLRVCEILSVERGPRGRGVHVVQRAASCEAGGSIGTGRGSPRNVIS